MLPSISNGESLREITDIDKFNQAQKRKDAEDKKWR